MIEKKERNYHLDNVKFVLICLVVIAHLISPLGTNPYIRFIYRYIYIFHMPAMLLLSGYFSKKYYNNGALVKNKIFNYILLYLVFQIIYTLINHGNYSLYQSQMGLWYLQVLIIYQLIMPIVIRIKPKYAITFSILFCLLVGFDKSAGHVASLSRTLVFFPFYLIGYYIDGEKIEYCKNNIAIKIISCLIFVFVALFLYNFITNMPFLTNLISGKASYYAMGLSNISGLLFRMIWLLICMLMCLSLIIIIPKRKLLISKLGSRTLQVFLLHLIIVVYLRKTEFFVWLSQFDDLLVSIIMILIGIILSIILSLKLFSYPFDFIMKLKFNWLLEQKDDKGDLNEKN